MLLVRSKMLTGATDRVQGMDDGGGGGAAARRRDAGKVRLGCVVSSLSRFEPREPASRRAGGRDD